MIRKQSNIIVDTGKILVFWIDGQINHNIPLIGSLWLSKESAFNVGDLGSIPGLGRFPGGGRGNPIQFFCLENPHGQRCLVGYSPWDHKESDTAEFLSTAHLFYKGWNGVGGGRKVQWGRTYVHLRLSHANVRAKPTQYCRAITLQLKINKSWQRKGKLSGMQSVRK